MNNRSAFDRIQSFDLSPIMERVIHDHPEVKAKYDLYEAELRKFFAVIAAADAPIGMISPRIDAMWHSLITYTPLYRAFCEEAFGFYVDHMPRTSKNRIPESAIWNFMNGYREQFGEIPDPWYDGLPAGIQGDLDQGKVPAYLLWSGWVPVKMLGTGFVFNSEPERHDLVGSPKRPALIR